MVGAESKWSDNGYDTFPPLCSPYPPTVIITVISSYRKGEVNLSLIVINEILCLFISIFFYLVLDGGLTRSLKKKIHTIN